MRLQIQIRYMYWLGKVSELNQDNIRAAEDNLSVDDFLFLVRVEIAV